MYTSVFSPFPASFTTSYPTRPHSDLPRTLATPGLYSACPLFSNRLCVVFGSHLFLSYIKSCFVQIRVYLQTICCQEHGVLI